MRIPPQSEPTLLSAALVAPIVTPIVALVSLAWFPNMGTSAGYYLIAMPVVIVLALVFGYLGMFLVCLPFFAILSKAKLLSAPTLCLLTSVTGAALWTWLESNPEQPILNSLVVGFLCSFSVSVSFCFLAGGNLHPGRTRIAER